MREGDESPPEPPSLPTDRKDSLQAIRTAIYGKAARKREATDVNELVSDFGFLYCPLYLVPEGVTNIFPDQLTQRHAISKPRLLK